MSKSIVYDLVWENRPQTRMTLGFVIHFTVPDERTWAGMMA